MMRKRNHSIAAILLATGIVGCAAEKPKPVPDKVPVTVATVTMKDVPIEIRAIGTLKPVSTVEVKALVSGELTKVWFAEGSEVRKGSPLFTIDPRPYQAATAQAAANLARDEANLRYAESEAVRYGELVKNGYVTRNEYERIAATAQSARAVAAADRAALQSARLQLSYCDIRSPMNGRTGNILVHAGNLVKANDAALVSIHQIDPIYVQFSVPQGTLELVRARGALQALPVTASSQAGGVPLAVGRLTFVDNAVDVSTGTIALKATFSNATRVLWPGQFVNVAMRLSSRSNAIVVPIQAVQAGQKVDFVYVVTGGDGVEMRPVTIATRVAQQAVVSTGLHPGETVVTDGQLRLTPKSKIQIKGEPQAGGPGKV